MKIVRLLAIAGLALATLGISSAADAKDHDRKHGYQDDRRGNDQGRYRQGGGHDNGNHYGWANGRGHQRCYSQWRHHRRVRICR